MMNCIYWCGVCASVVFGWVWWKLSNVKFYSDIPILPGYPVLGTVLLLVPIFGFTAHREILHLLDHYGAICQCLLLGKHCMIINDPRVIKIAMEKVKGKGDIHQRIFTAVNIFSSDTNLEWKQRRQAFRHAFTQVNLRHFANNLDCIATRLCVLLEQHAKSNTVACLDQLFGRFALDVICTVGLAWDFNFLQDAVMYEKLNKGVQGMFEYSWVPHIPMFGWLAKWNVPIYPYKEFSQAASTIRKFQIDILNRLKEKHKLNELVDGSFGKILMDFGCQFCLTDEELLSEILVFIVAGHETTAHTLSWIVYALCRDNKLQQTCQQIMSNHLNTESDFGNHEKNSGATSFSLLPEFIEGVIKETMRKYPAASRGSFRVVNEEDGVELPVGLANRNGERKYPEVIHLKKGTWIGINFYAAHLSKKNWGDDADLFLPERWLKRGDQSDNSDMNSPSAFAGVGHTDDAIAFLPFSYGPRNCIGMNMALWEIRAVLKVLLTKFSFKFVDPKYQDEEYVLQTDITLKPIHQFPVLVTTLR